MHYSVEELWETGVAKENGGRIVEINIAAVDTKASSQEHKDRSDEVDFCSLMENMSWLRKWCNEGPSGKSTIPQDDKNSFFTFFQDAIIGAYYRYRENKVKAWEWKKVLACLICSAVLPILSAIILNVFTDSSEILLGLSNVLACAVVAVWILAYVYYEWTNRKNHMETWVRHSACFGRLNLALSRFMLSNHTDEDYQEFISATFAILEQNLDQFAMNLSSNGLAQRVNTNSEKGKQDDE